MNAPISSVPGAPALRREPYRLLFPLGVLLAWGGVLHWLLFALGVIEEYRSIFHSMAQIQGFMSCFAVGFLFTLIPRRTGTAAPSAWQMGVALAAPVGTAVSAWYERWALSQVFWLILMVVVAGFTIRRFLAPGAARRIPNSFVWVPISLLIGFFFSILTGVAAAMGEDYMWLHDLGRGVLLQGMFTGLVIGVGGMLLPLITRGEPPAEAGFSRDRWIKVLHVVAALLFVASFWLEALVSVSLGFGLRAAVVAAALIPSARLWRRPSLPGLHRRLVWIAAWMLPLGYAFVAALPDYRKAGLHVAFIGGFALMALAVSVHVVLSHGGKPEPLGRWPWQLVATGGLLAIALAARLLVDFDRARLPLWLGLAAASFLLATLSWAALVVPAMRTAQSK